MRGSIPLIVFGDGPRLTSGLARIARDVAARLVANAEMLGIRFAQVGVDFPEGLHWQSWDFYGFQPTKRDYGRTMLAQVVEELQDECGEPPIILTMTDPSRVFDVTRTKYDTIDGDVEIDTERVWGYFPIDSHTPNNSIGGPAAEAVLHCERVLAYGRYGASILQQTLRQRGVQQAVSYLPHGLEMNVFSPAHIGKEDLFFHTWLGPLRDRDALIVGAVATNQPRKDIGLLFATVAEIKRRGHPVGLWLVTDIHTNAWDVGELAYQFALEPREVCVTASDMGPLTDLQLAARYALSDVTIAPGLGEGFGYPIVESLACGTPVIHGAYAGGADLIPEDRWLVDPIAWRLESAYVLQRPVFKPADFATAALGATTWARGMAGRTTAAYCRGAVAHLDWQYLWPRWEAWIKRGLHGSRRAAEPLQPVAADGGGVPAQSV